MAWQLDFESGLAGLLGSDVTVQVATSGNIFPGESHEQTDLPYIVYSTSYRRERDLSTGEVAGTGAWEVQADFLVWHKSYDESVDLAARVIALERNNATIGGVSVRTLIADEIQPIQRDRAPGVVDYGARVLLAGLLDIS